MFEKCPYNDFDPFLHSPGHHPAFVDSQWVSGIRKFWVLEQVWVFLSRYFLAHFCHIYDLKTFRMAAFTLLFLFFLVGMSISD